MTTSLLRIFVRNKLHKSIKNPSSITKVRYNTVVDDEKQTHFGFKTVKENEKAEKVHEVFRTVADSYDVMNDAMSMGVHRIWKDIFVQRLSPTHGTRLLDVAGGTGDISFRFLKYLKNLPINDPSITSHVTVCDINQAMLDVGKTRAERLDLTKGNAVDIDWVCGDAEKLPFVDNSFTAYTIAFGIRNVTHIDLALQEAYRVLRPGGRFMCLEFSLVENELLRWVYDQYSFQVIPPLGQVLAAQWQPYQYLVESIRRFPDQHAYAQMIRDVGFEMVTFENLSFGVCAIHSGFKL